MCGIFGCVGTSRTLPILINGLELLEYRGYDSAGVAFFENKKINIMAYTIETVIAEKFESIMKKNITTTRAKDFYDLYMLINKHRNEIDNQNLFRAIENTFNKRNTQFNIEEFKDIIEMISESSTLRRVYADYQEKLDYTKNVSFDNTINALENVVDILEGELAEV